MRPITIVAGLLLAGCAPKSPPAEARPTSVVVRGFEARDIDFTGVRGDLVLELTGRTLPEPEALDWDLVLADVVVLSGHTATSPLQDGRVDVPLEVRWDEVEPALAHLGSDPSLPWSVTGILHARTSSGPVTLPVLGAGTLPALVPPEVALEAFLLHDLDLRNGLAQGDLLVAFGGPSPAELLRFRHRVFVDDVEVHEGEPPPADDDGLLPRIETLDAYVLPLSIDLNLLDEAVVDALATTGPLTLRLEGTAIVRTPYGELPLDVDVEGPVTVRDMLEEPPLGGPDGLDEAAP